MNNNSQRYDDAFGTNKHKNRRMRRATRIALTVAAMILLVALITLMFRMFGRVDLSASEIGETSETVAGTTMETTGGTLADGTTSSPASGTTTSAGTSTTASKAPSGSHYVQPANAEWNLKLVNKWNAINSNYAQSLVAYAGGNKFDSRAIDKLNAIVSASNGKIKVASLYRSIEQQTTLFNRQVDAHMAQGMSRAAAEEKTSSLVARPGTSEHNLGLAADFLFDNNSQLLESYEKTATYSWMMSHCADYGFILRFPKNKQDVTGVTFEPWHYRYVGETAAHEIMSRGITLEEYLQEKGK